MIPKKFSWIMKVILFNFALEFSDTILQKVCLNNHVIFYNYTRDGSNS